MALARLYKSAESISSLYEPSASAAMRELERRSGVTVVVLAPYGGSRTDAEGRVINPYLDPRLSDHNYRKGRALDVNNRGTVTSGLAARERLTWAQAVALYYKIWAKYGWRNIQINGDPFPSEPWHMANHSSTPQGVGGVPLAGTTTLPTQPKDDDMFGIACSTLPVDKRHALIGWLGSQILTDKAAEEEGLAGRTYKHLDAYTFAREIARAESRGAEFAARLPVAAAGDIDEAALAAALGPLLASDADLAAAVAAINAATKAAVPTTFTAS